MTEALLTVGRKGRSVASRVHRDLAGLLYVAPVMIVLLVALILPAGFAVYYSLLKLRSVRPEGFAGFKNYVRVLSEPGVAPMLLRTLGFALAAVIITVVIAMAIAAFLNRLTTNRAIGVQILVILPWVISTVVGALLFRWFYASDISPGVYVLGLLGVDAKPLTDSVLAMIVLILVAVWRTLGFAVLMLLAGMKAIPADYYESARVDGADAGQQFWHITLPMMKTPLVITTVVLMISNLNNVEAPLVTTGGGPGDATQILPLTIYQKAFTYFDFSGGVSLSVIALLLTIGLVFAYLRLSRWSV